MIPFAIGAFCKHPKRSVGRTFGMTRQGIMRSLLLILSLVLASCAGKPSFKDAKLSDRQLDLEVFFAGKTTAYGQFQDIFGTPQRRFRVDMTGEWNGKVLRLVEDFSYDDGTKEQRVWTLTKTGPDTWEGTAPGVLGAATGEEDGDRFNWQYTIDLPVPAGILRVRFDDWMFLLSEDRLLNIAYMKRFGLDIGTVVIMFEKER